MADTAKEAVALAESPSEALVREAELPLADESVEDDACECDRELDSLVEVAEEDADEAVRVALEAKWVRVLE